MFSSCIIDGVETRCNQFGFIKHAYFSQPKHTMSTAVALLKQP